MIVPQYIFDRVIRKADRDESTGCLVSRYSVGSHGYAQVGWQGEDGRVMTLCHLVVWTYYHGSIPKGMTVDHEECRNRKCIEIRHLRLLPNLENARRNAPGRDWELGTCINGHGPEYWNEKREGNSKGYCRACRAEARGQPIGPHLITGRAYCRNGHDTAVVGLKESRIKSPDGSYRTVRRCRACLRAQWRREGGRRRQRDAQTSVARTVPTSNSTT